MRRASLGWWVPPLAAAGALAALDPRAGDGDLPFFLHAARTLLSGDWGETYANPSVQAGPLFLGAVGLLDRAAGEIGLAVGVQVGLVALLLAVAGRVLRGRAARGPAQLVIGLGALALGLPHAAFADGHPAQAAIPLLWILAALDARDGRGLRAGALLAAAAGLETWGVLGAAVLLLAPARRVAAGLAAQAAATVALYAPFVLSGDFRMLDYRWVVHADTPLGLLVDPGTPFTWRLRLAQGAAALLAGGLVALALRRRPQAVWAAPLALVAVRLVLDPARHPWYWLALDTLVLVAAAELLTGGLVREALARRKAAALARPSFLRNDA